LNLIYTSFVLQLRLISRFALRNQPPRQQRQLDQEFQHEQQRQPQILAQSEPIEFQKDVSLSIVDKSSNPNVSFISQNPNNFTSKKQPESVLPFPFQITIQNPFFVCNNKECSDKAEIACTNRHIRCGHFCGGILDEHPCLPCLNQSCIEQTRSECKITQVGSDYCNICWIEDLHSAPSIMLKCCHIFHFQCIQKRLHQKWPGPSVTFTFMDCPLCGQEVEHESLMNMIGPSKKLKK
jgi:hypothetical protein